MLCGLILGTKAITLNQLEQKVTSLEKRVLTTERQLEQGGKRYQTVSLSKLLKLSMYVTVLATPGQYCAW